MPTTESPSTTPNVNDLITSLEKKRKSKVLIYITGDRLLKTGNQILPYLQTQVSGEVISYFDEILRDSKSSKISLVIYTNGGQIETPWPLVNLIREACKEFEVIILKKSLSAGTLISLGADRIVMPRGSFLSPIDPARGYKGSDGTDKKLEIEDIIGFIDFAKDKVGINDQLTLGEVLKELSKEIDPSVIGSINRTHSLIRRLAKNLLSLHNQKLPEHQTKELIENLTEKLFSHTHLISSKEAIDIGFNKLIEIPDDDTQKIVDDIFNHYSGLMKLREPLVVEKIINENDKIKQGEVYNEECLTALLHSKNIKYKYAPVLSINANITQGGQPGTSPAVNISIGNQEWVRE